MEVWSCCTRRAFLRAGMVGAAGLALARRAAAEGESARRSADRLIVLWMAGGMSQTDTFDPKPGTKSAGPLRAIGTASRGVRYSELLPRLAERSEALAVVRSMATREGNHERGSYLLHTGYLPSGTVAHPDVGALLAAARPDAGLDLPPYVAINPGGGGIQGGGFLGVDVAPFKVADPTQPVADLGYAAGVDARRFARRRRLLEAVERRFGRSHPGAETLGHRSVYERADRLMHSPTLKAFDLSQEPSALRQAYGMGRFGQGCLMARRLVEVGVPAVEVELGGWDTHTDGFTRNRPLAEQLDAGLSALLRDLHERGLLRRTLVLVLTEFGRTPQINANDGRDHFPTGWSVALAGGPIRGGQTLGATNEDGTRLVERPVSAQDLMATVFAALGLDPAAEHLTRGGRPIRAVDAAGAPVQELLVG